MARSRLFGRAAARPMEAPSFGNTGTQGLMEGSQESVLGAGVVVLGPRPSGSCISYYAGVFGSRGRMRPAVSSTWTSSRASLSASSVVSPVLCVLLPDCSIGEPGNSYKLADQAEYQISTLASVHACPARIGHEESSKGESLLEWLISTRTTPSIDL